MNTRRARPRLARNRQSERGLTLIEALVAITVFAVVFIAALTLYSVASSAYLRTDSAVIQQQNVRFSMDRMTETLRDAGSGYNTFGAKNLADEQIEGSWESAVFVRGDFDGQRESALESATFPIVTAGNDEIVGFVLLKNGAGTLPIQVKTDLTGPSGKRDAILTFSTGAITNEETVTINVAARTVAEQTNPPYQLARVTFTGATPKYEIIADNIYQLKFEYLPVTGTTPVALVAPGSGADGERDERALIRKFNVKLIGQTDRRDLSLKTATQNRTFTLEQAIVPPALGIVGGRHELVPAVSIAAPAYITVCTGHARQHLVRWPSAGTGIQNYEVRITADPATGPGGITVPAYNFPAATVGGKLEFAFEHPAADIAARVDRQFTFKVAGTSGGSPGAYTPTVSQSAVNSTPGGTAGSIPTDVQGVDAAQAPGENALQVTWNVVTQNVSAVNTSGLCASAGSGSAGNTPPSPWNIDMSDLGKAKVYRDGVAAATTDISNLTVGTLVNTPGESSFIDRHAAPCESYFYRVKAADLADPAVTSLGFSAAMGAAKFFTPPTDVVPGMPTGVRAGGMIGTNGSEYVFDLVWDPVITTAAGAAAAVSHYQVERSSRVGSTGSFSTPEFEDVHDATTTPETPKMTNAAGQALQWQYRVRAIYDCTPERPGEWSTAFLVTCTPGNGVSLTTTLPAAGDAFMRPGEGSVPIEMTAVGTGFAGADIIIKSGTSTFSGPPAIIGAPTNGKYAFTAWLINNESIPDGFYTIEGYATVNGCRIAAPVVQIEIDSIACGQRIISAAYAGSGNNTATSMTFKIENSCQNAVTISAMTATWSGAGTATITQVSSGATHYPTSSPPVSSGGVMTFTTPLTLATGSVFSPTPSPAITFTFSDSFTSDNTQNGVLAKFSSILASVTSPTPAAEEELIDGAPIP